MDLYVIMGSGQLAVPFFLKHRFIIAFLADLFFVNHIHVWLEMQNKVNKLCYTFKIVSYLHIDDFLGAIPAKGMHRVHLLALFN